MAALLNLALRNIDNIDEYGLLLIAILLLEVPVLQRLTSEHMVLRLQMEKAKFNETVLLLHLITLQLFFGVLWAKVGRFTLLLVCQEYPLLLKEWRTKRSFQSPTQAC